MNRKLRVLTLTAFFGPGGTSGRILGMVHGLDRSRIDQRLCTLYARQPEIASYFGTTAPLFDELGIPISNLGNLHPAPGTVLPLRRRLAHSLGLLSRSVARLAHIVRSEQIDVIDAHLAPSTVIAGITGAITGRPVVATDYHLGNTAPIMLWPVAGRLAFDLAAAVVTDSQPSADDLKRWMYRRKSKVKVIPNGISPPKTSLSRAESRSRFGISDSEIVITQVSTLQPHKGHRVLLDAAREVIEQEPRARFMLVGFTRGRDMEYKRELEAQAKRLGIADRVFIGPYAGAIGDVWQAADIAAHATLFDSLPNAIIEGMSLAKPAAVTAVGGIPDLVSNEETGLVVAPGDPHAFADALLRLIRDPQRAKRLGETAFARYRSSYSAEQTAKKLESLFLEVAGAT